MSVTEKAAPTGHDDEVQYGPLLSWRRLDELVGVCCLVLIVGSITWGVLTRYVMPQPASWSFELAVIAFAWMVFFGAAAGVRNRSHADIDALVMRFPRPVRRVIAVGNWLLVGTLFGGMTVLFVWQAWIAHTIYTVALNLPRSVVYGPLAVASALMLYQHAKLHPWRPDAEQPPFTETMP